MHFLQVLSVFIFYSKNFIPWSFIPVSADFDKANRYKQDRRMQFIFFLIATFSGPRLIWLMNRANWRLVMRQASSNSHTKVIYPDVFF